MLSTLFGLEPQRTPNPFDAVTTRALIAGADKFLILQPTLAEIQVYRARMANPWADLKLADYALKLASTRDEVFSI